MFQLFYMFGGNPGSDTDFRLDDFWQLEVCTINLKALLHNFGFRI